MVTTHNITQGGRAAHALLLLMSDWGFAIITASFLKIQIGFWQSGELTLSPLFIGGLFLLALISGIEKLNRPANSAHKA
jgi:hypothetical protein